MREIKFRDGHTLAQGHTTSSSPPLSGGFFAQGLVREWLHDTCYWNAGSQALLAWSSELVDSELWSQLAVALASPLPVSDVLALKASPGLSTYGKVLTKQWLREMKEAGFWKLGYSVKVPFFFFYFSILKFFKSFRKLKFILWTHIPYPPTQRIIVFLIPSDIFLLRFLLYHVLDHILVVLIFLLCFRLYYLAVACFW